MTDASSAQHLVPVQPRRHLVSPAGRWTMGGVLIAVAALTMVFIDTTRTWEAVASAWILDTIVGLSAFAVAGEPEIFLLADPPWILTISLGCAVGFIVAPFLAIAAVLSTSGRFAPTRMIAGILLACVVVVIINQVRVVSIGWALVEHGAGGYGWMHTVGGSLMSLVGIAVALLVLWRVGMTGPRRSRRGRTEAGA